MSVRQLRVVVETGDYEQAVRFGRQVSPRIRLAFEAQDAAATTQRLTDAGAIQVAPPTRTPWNSLNARLNAPAELHITIFEDHDEPVARKADGRTASPGISAQNREKPMSALQAIADRVEIEALRGEFTDAVMTRDYDRCASLFRPSGVLRMPNVPAELTGPEEIRAWGERVPELVDFLLQNTYPGVIRLDGDTASGRAYIQEIGRLRDGRSEPIRDLSAHRALNPIPRPNTPMRPRRGISVRPRARGAGQSIRTPSKCQASARK
jgi:hypothetical protein